MINKLITRIKETNAPIVVGLDPMMKFVPEYIKKAAFTEYGETLEGAAEAIWQYNKGIVDAIYDLVPAVKPQVAMYEQFGIPGMVAFKKTVDYCKEKGLIVIGDIKRGDIGSTSEAYAVGHLGKVQVGSRSYYGFDEEVYQVCTLTALCAVTGHQDKCLGHYLTKYLSLLRVGCTYHSTYIAVRIAHAVSSPGCDLFSYQLIQRSAIN